MAEGQRSDGELVRASAMRDQEAYKELVARYQGHGYGLAFSLVNNWAEAQDIAQETFIRAYLNRDQLRDPERFAAWLRRVAFGVSVDWLRTFRPKQLLPAELTKEMAIVQEVFNEHKLPPEFASKALENVPALRWGTGKDCTYAGALEAAMAVTPHAYSYTDLMGFMGLALRVRWFKPTKGPDGSRELPISKIVGMWFTLEEHREAPPRREAVIGALRMAADQWKRVSGKAGPGEYWYGEAAWERWLGDLRRADSVTQAQRDKMLDVSRWVYLRLTDARKAAVAFLKESVASLPEPARGAARRAQETYEKQVSLLTSRDWPREIGPREMEFLAEVRRLDAAAIEQIGKGLNGQSN
jgi:RNA polymerase sigma factor (sigma-70 family)